MIDKDVLMPCTKEQYERDIKGKLEEWHMNWAEGETHLCFMYNSKEVTSFYLTDDVNDIVIPFYNPECFLAVVCTDPSTDEVSVGEALHCNKGYSEFGESFYTGEVMLVEEVVEFRSQSTVRGSFGLEISNNTWRKATPQEIINHFEKEDLLKKSNEKAQCVTDDDTITITVKSTPEIQNLFKDYLSDGKNTPFPTEKIKNRIKELNKTVPVDPNNPNGPQKPLFYVEKWRCFDGSDQKEWKEVSSKLNNPPLVVYNYEGEILNKFKLDGYKESKGKLEYELDWEFIEAIARRMQKAKIKYGKDNWKKPIDPETLKQASFRHQIEIMKGNYEDDGSELGNIEALACNQMMLWYQLKHYKNEG